MLFTSSVAFAAADRPTTAERTKAMRAAIRAEGRGLAAATRQRAKATADTYRMLEGGLKALSGKAVRSSLGSRGVVVVASVSRRNQHDDYVMETTDSLVITSLGLGQFTLEQKFRPTITTWREGVGGKVEGEIVLKPEQAKGELTGLYFGKKPETKSDGVSEVMLDGNWHKAARSWEAQGRQLGNFFKLETAPTINRALNEARKQIRAMTAKNRRATRELGVRTKASTPRAAAVPAPAPEE